MIQTLARPYTKAIAAHALKENALAVWSTILSFLAKISENKLIKTVCFDPQYSPSELSRIFIAVLKKSDVELELLHQNQAENLICLLADYRRLLLLPVIAALYEERKAEIEKTADVFVTSAFKISDKLSSALKSVLEIKFNCKIKLMFNQDKNIIGGLIIHMGDFVIDMSIQHQLEKLKQAVIR